MRIFFCSILFFVQPFCSLFAQSDAAESQFVRFVSGLDSWQGELQTAVISYENDSGVILDLVAAVHIGEPEYYEELNAYFQTRDVVLYELVAEADDRPTPGTISSGGSPLGFVQQSLAGFLSVSFQLNHIDYSAPNFRHADLSPTQLRDIMQAKNENFFSMFLSLALAQMAMEQSATSDSLSSFNLLTVIRALIAEDRANAFKYLFAEELGRSNGVIVGPALEQQLTILGDRNRVALEVLADTLQQATATKISLFYGAAHMPGIERGITDSLGFKKLDQHWLSAWKIP